MRRLVTILTLLALTTACGEGLRQPASVGPGGPSTDYEASWRLLSGHGPDGPIAAIEGADVSLVIEGDRGSGRAACNSYDVSLEISGSALRVDGGGMTDMGCAPDVMEAQGAYMSALMAADGIERTGETLTLTGDEVELIFERVPPPPTREMVGTTWKLESLIEGGGAAGVMTEAAPAHLLLSEDGTFVGSTGCRGLSGEWREDGYEIHFFTMHAKGRCPEGLLDQDSLVVEVLGDGFTVDISGNRMTVMNEDGATGLDYRASAPQKQGGSSFTYKVHPRRVVPGEAPLATFTNTGDAVLEYGNGYDVAIHKDGWQSLEQPADSEIFCAFTDEAYMLETGASKSEEISVCDRNGEPRALEPGLYRVTKTVRVSGSNEVLRAKAFFRVVSSE